MTERETMNPSQDERMRMLAQEVIAEYGHKPYGVNAEREQTLARYVLDRLGEQGKLTPQMTENMARAIGNTMHWPNHRERARAVWKAAWDESLQPVPNARAPSSIDLVPVQETGGE